MLGTNTYVFVPLISKPGHIYVLELTVLDCSVDSNGTYHLEEAHLFRNSVSTDSISNNNAPSMLQNFTPYPLRQPSSYNFKSSTLTGYIGRLDMKLNQYIDTVDMAEALYNLSVSNNPKFLRDRKGNLWRIQTNAAVSMQTGDTMVPQPYFGSFPWAEVGAADGISIICQPGDGAWDRTTGQEPDSGETVTKIVVTAPFGSTVTLTNGQESYTEVCYGYITYQPATPGDGDGYAGWLVGQRDHHHGRGRDILRGACHHGGLRHTYYCRSIWHSSPYIPGSESRNSAVL